MAPVSASCRLLLLLHRAVKQCFKKKLEQKAPHKNKKKKKQQTDEDEGDDSVDDDDLIDSFLPVMASIWRSLFDSKSSRAGMRSSTLHR